MSVVTVRVLDQVAIITIDSPPVSIGNAGVRRGLHDALQSIETRCDVTSIVLASARQNFYAGSDIREFDGELAAPSLPEVNAAIEGSARPVVAALNGLTLGGGLELALACDVRIAETHAEFGLPEVTLGVLPGAGGTVRLPRLIGVPRALGVVASGDRVSASTAREWGLVDEVVDEGQLLDVAIERSRHASKRLLRAASPPVSDDEDLRLARERALKGGKVRPNVARAVELVCEAVELDAENALTRARAVFDELRLGSEARNLRYLFFAKRIAARDLPKPSSAPKIRSVGIAGAGTMGLRIARAFLAAGIDVILYELSSETLARAAAELSGIAADDAGPARLRPTSETGDLAAADVVIDAVFEDTEVKRALFAELDKRLPSSTIVASNTSYLDLNELGAAFADPTRFLGLHFFNPADRNQLLEVVRTTKTGPEALAVAAAVARTLNKTTIVAEVDDGFVANRVYADYRTQAEFLVEEGASPREVDDAMRALGMPIGPFAVADMSGLDIAWARRKRLASTRRAEQRYVTIADSLCEAGRLGKKTGAGWYRYTEDAPRGTNDLAVAEIIRDARAVKGIVPVEFTPEEIQRRIICTMLTASADILAKGVANRASDIDVALTVGFGFPAWLGGPLRYAAAQSRSWVVEGLRNVYESDPVGFAGAADVLTGEIPEHIEHALNSATA